jgi:hypothetical protein
VLGSENRASCAKCEGVLRAERAHHALTLANHLAAHAGRQVHAQHGTCHGYGPDAAGSRHRDRKREPAERNLDVRRVNGVYRFAVAGKPEKARFSITVG